MTSRDDDLFEASESAARRVPLPARRTMDLHNEDDEGLCTLRRLVARGGKTVQRRVDFDASLFCEENNTETFLIYARGKEILGIRAKTIIVKL